MNDIWLIFIFLALWTAKDLYWGYQIQKLINKVMSRSYHEYQRANNPEVKKSNVTPIQIEDGENNLEGVMSDIH